MVGNGVTNWTYDTTPATVDVAYYRSLLSSTTYRDMQKMGCDYAGIALNDITNISADCLGYFSVM